MITALSIPVRLALLTCAALAQEPTTVEDSRPHLWTGEVAAGERPVDAGFVEYLVIAGQPESLAAAVEESLTGAKLAREVDRDFREAAQEVERAWLVANVDREIAERVELLVLVAEERASLLLELGEVEGARLAVSNLFLRPDMTAVAAYGLVLAPAGAQLSAAEAAALDDPRLAAVRARIEEVERSIHDELEDEIADALAAQRSDLVRGLGVRALPTLSKMVREHPDFFPAVQGDALMLMVEIGEIQAARLIRDLMPQGGFLFRKRVVRAMVEHQVVTNPGTWVDGVRASAPPLCLEPEWLDILAALLPDPETGRDCLPLVRQVALRDALSPALQSALGDALLSGDADLAREAMESLDIQCRIESAKLVYDRAISSANTHVRRFAADRLSQFADSSELRTRAQDPDLHVRVALARSLRKIEFEQGSWEGGKLSRMFGSGTEAIIDARARVALARLILDEVVAVRQEAARSIAELPEPLDRTVYDAMAADPDEVTRYYMTRVNPSGMPFYAELLAALAGDPAESVQEAVEGCLGRADWENDAAAFLPALLVRVAQSPEFAAGGVLRSALRTTEGMTTITPWALEHDNTEALSAIIGVLVTNSRRGGGNPPLEALPDEQLASLIVRAAGWGDASAERLFDACEHAEWGLIPIGAMELIMGDRAADLSTRLRAASIAARRGGEHFTEAFLDIATSPGWDQRNITPEDLGNASVIARSLPEAMRNPLLLRVVQQRAVPDSIAKYLLMSYDVHEALGQEVSLAVLERWFQPGVQDFLAVGRAIASLGSMPEAADIALLRAASRHPAYSMDAIAAMALLRHDDLLPTLGDCLRAEWMPGEDRVEVQLAAARAIEGYLSIEAARQLLSGLGWASSDSVRDACFAGLDTIHRYKDEVARWEENAVERPTPESAKQRLFDTLSSDDAQVRVHSALGLAALGALEAIPDLIELLKDPDPGVRAAAEDALGRLERAGRE